MFGATRAYEKWKAVVIPVLEAGPSHPHYKIAVASWRNAWAFTFGAKLPDKPEEEDK